VILSRHLRRALDALASDASFGPDGAKAKALLESRVSRRP